MLLLQLTQQLPQGNCTQQLPQGNWALRVDAADRP